LLTRAGVLLDKYPLAGHIAVLVSGALIPLSLAPFNWWPLSIVSVLLFLVCIDKQSLSTTILRFYLYYAAMFGLGVSWIYVSLNVYGGASPALAGFLVMIFVLALSLTGLLHGYVYGRFITGVPSGLLLGFPAIWVLSEWVRSWLLTGFPWLFVGYGHLSSPLIGYAPLVGILGVSFIVVLSATLLYRFMLSKNYLYLVFVAATWLLGFVLHEHDFVVEKEQVKVVAVQGNIDQHTKWQRNMVMPILKQYRGLTEPEWGAALIVWPEAAITVFRENADLILEDLDLRGKQSGSSLLLGVPDRDSNGNFLNSAISIGQGKGTYNKRRLVPFGEYVPLENLLRGLIKFFDLPMSHNRPGRPDQPALMAGDLKLSVSICYEVVYAELVRSTTALPDLLVTISNDTWFGTSIGPAQHLQMAQMRAIENGRYLIRATNNGITALVNHRGEIVDSLPQFEPGVLRAKAGIMTGVTPFHRFGQIPILLLCSTLLLGMALLRFFATRSRGQVAH
jgi:apolipoprotein N-acyltransferase